MPEFSIRLNQIDAGDEHYDFPIKNQWLATVLKDTDVRAPEGDDAGKLTLRAYRSGDDVIVHGHAAADLVVDCSRCLSDVRVPVNTELSLVMSPTPSGRDTAAEDAEISSDELGREYFDGDELVFDAIVRDQLLLELPMQPVCTDPPCPEWVKKYLTTAEEAEAQKEDKPLDPRLAPLRGLAKKLKGPKN